MNKRHTSPRGRSARETEREARRALAERRAAAEGVGRSGGKEAGERHIANRRVERGDRERERDETSRRSKGERVVEEETAGKGKQGRERVSKGEKRDKTMASKSERERGSG
ncbi:hypothetical protein KM043_011864 [Ampulex compressa]|nr:hypothetical protein KM043_011864 [Ampulex compressa]